MATIKKFEDLVFWQKARELSRYIYTLTKKPGFKNDYGLKNQIERATVSTMANQAEGFTRGTKIELINYFYIAKGSAGEVQSHLYIALDAGYISKEEFLKAYHLADQTQRLIQSFVDKVKAGARSGIQYRNVEMSKYRKDFVQEYMEEEGMVFTSQGVMKREEAKERGLTPIK